MYCYKCGKEIRNDSTFCKYCGAVQEGSEETVTSKSEPVQDKATVKKSPWKWICLSVLVIVLIVAAILYFGNSKPSPAVVAEEEVVEEGVSPARIEELSKSVLKLECYDKKGEFICMGSGVVAFQNDVVITNHHVACEDGVAEIKVISDDNQSCKVKSILAFDEGKDIAILQLERETNVVPLPLGESSGVLRGEKVLAIGSPLGLLNSASEGIISGFYEGEGYTDLQFTAPISAGSSGGALFNEKGEVIGITYASYVDGQNLNLAIPIDEVKELWKKVESGESDEFN